MTAPSRIACRAVLVDIEGTTSPIAFVHDVLFPYADEHLDAYVAAHRTEPDVECALRDVAREHELAAGRQGATDCFDDASVLRTLHRWIAQDRKSTPLKTLQGLIWTHGYATGRLRSRVYPDAADALTRWHTDGFALYVYSSGSVQAQQTLFRYSDRGDLRYVFRGYFDTTTGPKKEMTSYAAIAQAMTVLPAHIVFLSDVDAELDAARSAGLQTVRVMRPADTPSMAQGTRHACVTSLNDIELTGV